MTNQPRIKADNYTEIGEDITMEPEEDKRNDQSVTKSSKKRRKEGSWS